MTDESSEIVKWLGVHLRVPRQWEIVRHSLGLEKGSLVFVDRRRETLRLYWTSCERAPDLNRMLDDMRGKASLEFSGAKLAELRGHPGWQGFIREVSDGERVIHAAQFDSRTLRLIEVIVSESCDASEGKSLRARLLGNIEVAAKAEQARHFWAFGLNVTVPPGFRLFKTDVKPADVTFEFEQLSEERARPSGASAVVRRLGMAAAWAPAEKLRLVKQHAPGLSLADVEVTDQLGHHSSFAKGKETKPRILNWLGLGRRGEALLWHCEPTNAIYSVVTSYPKRTPVLAREFSMTCCEADHE